MAAANVKHTVEAGQEVGPYGSVVIDPETRRPGSGGRSVRTAVLKCGLCGDAYDAPIGPLCRGYHQVCPECTRHQPRPGAQKLSVVPGMRFGKGVVVDPEVRVRTPNGRRTVRYARMRCTCAETVHRLAGYRHDGPCGTLYLAPLSHLKDGQYQACARCVSKGPARSPAGRVYKNRGGYMVSLHVGWYKSRAEAEDIAARARSVILPGRPRP